MPFDGKKQRTYASLHEKEQKFVLIRVIYC